MRIALQVISRLAVAPLIAAVVFGAYGEPAHTLKPGKAPVHALDLPGFHRAEFPGCVPTERFVGIPASVIVVELDGTVRRMGFDKAWTRGANDNWADDLWVIGGCA